MIQNFDVFDFSLTDEDMATILELNQKESLFSLILILKRSNFNRLRPKK